MKAAGNRLFAIALVACLLTVTVGGAVITEEADESDAIFIIDDIVVISLAGFVASIIVGAVAGGAAGYLIGTSLTSGTDTVYVRNTEASTLASSILTGMTYYSNSLANYDQVWSLTDEHWIRQAELTSSFLWSADKEYSPYTAMADSGVYLNSAYMLTNASAQINAHFDSISERMGLWNQTETYRDAMTLKWSYGVSSIQSNSSFAGYLGSAANITSDSADRAYISGGDLWVFGGNATITDSKGTSYDLTQGCNNLDAITGFRSDVYELQAGRQYAGNLLPAIDGEAASVTSGLVMSSGDTQKLAMYVNGKVIVDGYQYNGISIDVMPEGGTTATADVTALFADYDELIRTIRGTMLHAASAAMTVWNIYDKAGSASSYLTTLTVPNVYDNVEIEQSQQEIITILAMEQLAEYYSANAGAIKTGQYTLSNGSLSLFCRGDIYDGSGTKIYENVIFTPFFYHDDVTLVNGDNRLAQSSIVAIWGSGTNLSGWDGSVDIGSTDLITLSPGSSMNVYEMEHDGTTVSSVLLEQKNIDIIEGGEIDPTPIPEPDTKGTNWIRIVLLIAGAILCIVGIFARDTRLVILGIAIAIIGILAGSWLWGFIS